MTIRLEPEWGYAMVPFEQRLTNYLPHATKIEHEGEPYLAVPYRIDETIILNNMGIPVPPPIRDRYDWPAADGRKPFDKQVLTSAAMTMNEHFYVLNDMGTGKTKSAIWAFDYMRKVKRVKKMLVVAPLSTVNFTWEREVMMTIPSLKVAVLTGTAERRRKLLATDADIYIVNHDGLRVISSELYDISKDKKIITPKRLDIDVICFDEAAAYRNARAERSRVARHVTKGRKYVWGMTGSPTPTAPTDAYGLAWLVKPDTAPKSFVHFRQDTMMQVSQFKWVNRKDSAETVAKLLQPAVRFSLDDITELPPVVYRDLQVPINHRSTVVYGELKKMASALLKEGRITAANGGILFNKLLQTSLGWVYDNDHNSIPMYEDGEKNARIEALIDIIESADRKVLVFSPYKSVTTGIGEALSKHKEIEFATVTGDTPHGERSQIFADFQSSEKYHVLNAHPECMAHGLTLTAADTIVWFGPTTKYEIYEQANARITRVGQTHKQQVIRMMATPVEQVVYKRLADREELQDSVLDLLAEITGDQYE